MMSRERELLERVRDTLLELKETYYDLYWDIQTALDHPSVDLREPLTLQQISVGNQSTLNVTRDAFKQGVKYAEKAHGIGGEE